MRHPQAPSLLCPPLAEQRHFLAAMGLEARVNSLLGTLPPAQQEQLMHAVHRLVASPGMGSAYKAFALAHFGADAAAGLAGFAPA